MPATIFARASADEPAGFDPRRAATTLSLVIPMYNEADGLDRLFSELEKSLATAQCSYEIVCVNDGSEDATLALLLAHRERNPAIKIVNLSRNFGKDRALSAGLSFCRGAAVLPLDADLQDPPSLIPAMLARWREGFDVVNAVRASRHGEGLLKRLSARLFYRAYNTVADTRIPPQVGDFRLLDRRVVEVLKEFPERSRFMKGLFAWVGFRQTAIPYDRPGRGSGRSSWSFHRLANFAIDGITAFSTLPLRFASWLGLGLFLFALLYIAFLVIRVGLVGRDTPGYASLMVTVLLFGGIQFTVLGIIGEYVGRIYDEVKRRPLFIVENTFGFDEAAVERPPAAPQAADSSRARQRRSS